MLTGQAVSNVFNGTQQLDSGGKENFKVIQRKGNNIYM